MFERGQFCSHNKKINTLPKSTLFVYSGHQKHISFKQTLSISPSQHEIVSSYILDPDLSVIAKTAKQQINLLQKIKRKDDNQESSIRYLLQNQKVYDQYKKTYNKYVEINDFLFGRQCQHRNLNCLIIRCDLISRVHTKIKVNALDSLIKLEQLRSELKFIVKQSCYSSYLKKIPYYLWQNILKYLKEEPNYTIEDPGSRNGTFLINQSFHYAPIMPLQSYQFQRQHYLIKINEIFEQKGKIIYKKIQKIQSDFDRIANYRHQFSKKVIYWNDLEKQMLKECQQEFCCLYFQVQYNQNVKYYFVVVVRKGECAALNIGSGQSIGINEKTERLQYEISLHGQIILKANKWLIYPVDEKQYVWTKLPLKAQYPLLKNHNYRFRLGHLNTISLKFHHFNQ